MRTAHPCETIGIQEGWKETPETVCLLGGLGKLTAVGLSVTAQTISKDKERFPLLLKALPSYCLRATKI